MLVAAVQMSAVEGDKPGAIAKAAEMIRSARGADLIILPELWNIGFMSFDRYQPEAEDRQGPTLAAMRELARETNAFVHTGSFVERDGSEYFNSSYLLSPTGEILANYRKIHLFGHQSLETALLSPGREVCLVDTDLGRLGLATCYDLRFPELFRRMAASGAGMFLVCSAWPHPRLEHWRLFTRARALENQCFLAAANSVGHNRDSCFVGHSVVVDPRGEALAEGDEQEAVLTCPVDLAEVARARREFSAFADRVLGLAGAGLTPLTSVQILHQVQGGLAGHALEHRMLGAGGLKLWPQAAGRVVGDDHLPPLGH